MHRVFSSHQKGSSLIEVLLYVAMLALVGGALFQVISILSQAELKMERLRTVRSDAAFVMEQIAADAKHASAIVLPSAGAGGNTLALTVGADTVSYACTANVLTKSTNGGVGVPLHSARSACTLLSVEHVDIAGGADFLRYHVTMQAFPVLDIPGQDAAVSLTSSVQLR